MWSVGELARLMIRFWFLFQVSVPKNTPCTNVQKLLLTDTLTSLNKTESKNCTRAIICLSYLYLIYVALTILQANSKKKKHFP